MLADLSPLDAPARPFRLLVAGVGGAGCRAARRLAGAGPDVALIHTDAQALGEPAEGLHRLQIGSALLHGGSTGGDAVLGASAAEADADALRALFRGYELVYFIGGLGGGTGSGALPVAARLAREASCATLALVTTPFSFEGDPRRRAADRALEALRGHADAVVDFPNDRLLEVATATPLSLPRAFALGDRFLGAAAPVLHALIGRDSLLRLDFADLQHLLRHADGALHLAAFSLPVASLRESLMADVLASPLLERGQALARARGLLVGVVAGPTLTLRDLDWLARELRAACLGPLRHLKFGAAVQEPLGDRVTLLLLSCDAWRDTPAAPLPPPAAAETAAPAEPAAPPAPGPRDTAPGGVPVQIEIPLPTGDVQGKFKDTETTQVAGEDLDIPTYIRRGIRLKG